MKVTNPSGGEAWSSLKLAFKLRTIEAQNPTDVTLQYENSTHVWCTLPLRHITTIKGTFVGLTGACVTPTTNTANLTKHFSLAAGHSLTIPLRIKYASAAKNVGTQTAIFTLETVNSTGTAIAPFTTTTVNGVPTHAPYATGLIHVNPTTKYTVTVHAAPPATAVPQGYVMSPGTSITTPANTIAHTIYYPVPTGTVRYLVTGHTFTPAVVTAPTPGDLGTTLLSTKGLSVWAPTR